MADSPNGTRSTSVRLGYWALLAYTWSAVSVELLSALSAPHLDLVLLHRWPVLVCWVLFAGVSVGYLRRHPLRISRTSFWRSSQIRTGENGVLLTITVLALACTLVTALVAAPNNWDSMVYHLSRVAQWASRGSVDFYHTGISRQVSQPPAGEYALLHTYLLTGGDRAANLVQWTAGLFALLGVRELASGFWPGSWDEGLRRRAGVWTVFVVAGIPMFLLQQSSTQNDLILGAVVVWSAVAALRHVQHRRSGDAAMAMLGLAMAWWTKGTALLLVPPILVLWKLALYPRKLREARLASEGIGIAGRLRAIWPSVRLGLLAVLVLALFNAPHALRNHEKFGSILGPNYQLANAEQGLTAQLGAGLGNTARNAAWLLRTPSETANRLLHDATGAFHGLLGRDLHDPEATWPWTPAFDPVAFGTGEHLWQEDYAPAPVFFLLLIAASLAIWINRSKTWSRPMQGYALAWWLLFFGFGLALRWQVWHMRLLLPFFMFAAVPVGAWLACLSRMPRAALGLALLIGSAPVWWGNYSRPWFGAQSIFTTPRSSQYFATWPELEVPYREAAAAIQKAPKTGSNGAALLLSPDAWEYPLWALSGTERLPSLKAQRDLQGHWHWTEPLSSSPDLVLVWPDYWAQHQRLECPDGTYERIRRNGEGTPAIYQALRP